MSDARIIFRSDRLEVRHVPARDERRQIVTFEPFRDATGFGAHGFGEAFFRREGLSALHVLGVDNGWYQYPEMDGALAVIRAAVRGAERVLAYGSSMGGYAAIRFADAVGATHVLALNPQYSVDRRIMPAEKRWQPDQKRIRFRPDFNGPIRCTADVTVAYDPLIAMDEAHTARIRRDIAIRPLRLPHAGHPVIPFLHQTGLLKPLVKGLATEGCDLSAIETEAAARSRLSSSWHVERSAWLARRRRTEEALELALKAVALSPGDPSALFNLGRHLHRARRHDAAVEALRAAASGWSHPGIVNALSRALFSAGARAEALQLAEELVRRYPRDANFLRCLGRMRSRTGDHRNALRDHVGAIRLRPDLVGVVDLLSSCVRPLLNQARVDR